MNKTIKVGKYKVRVTIEIDVIKSTPSEVPKSNFPLLDELHRYNARNLEDEMRLRSLLGDNYKQNGRI